MNVGLHPSVVRHFQILGLTGGGAVDVLEWWCHCSSSTPGILNAWCHIENGDLKLLFLCSPHPAPRNQDTVLHHISVYLHIGACRYHPSPLGQWPLLMSTSVNSDVAKNEKHAWVTQSAMISTSMLTIEISLPRHTSPMQLTNDDVSPIWREEAIRGYFESYATPTWTLASREQITTLHSSDVLKWCGTGKWSLLNLNFSSASTWRMNYIMDAWFLQRTWWSGNWEYCPSGLACPAVTFTDGLVILLPGGLLGCWITGQG